MTLLGRSAYGTLKWQERTYPWAAWLPTPPPSFASTTQEAGCLLLPSYRGKYERRRK
jgi:hypothetical protein